MYLYPVLGAMENDSKKRKNKKKKNKQAKSTEDITSIGRTAHLQQNLLATSEQSIHLQSSNGGEVDNSGHSESDARPDQHELVKKLQEHTLVSMQHRAPFIQILTCFLDILLERFYLQLH